MFSSFVFLFRCFIPKSVISNAVEEWQFLFMFSFYLRAEISNQITHNMHVASEEINYQKVINVLKFSLYTARLRN